MSPRGFTLIELLVVISIIGMLASMVLASLKSARDKAELSYQAQVVTQYRNALNAYFNEFGYYPIVDPTDTTSAIFQYCLLGDGCASYAGRTINGSATLDSMLAPYISKGRPFNILTNTGGLNPQYGGPVYSCVNVSCTAARIDWQAKEAFSKCIPGPQPIGGGGGNQIFSIISTTGSVSTATNLSVSTHCTVNI